MKALPSSATLVVVLRLFDTVDFSLAELPPHLEASVDYNDTLLVKRHLN